MHSTQLNSNSEMTSFINIKVKSTVSDAETLDITVNINETVKKLKLTILNKLTNHDNAVSETVSESVLQRDRSKQRVRLIYNGRLLQPDTKCIKDFNIEDKSYLHAVVSNLVDSNKNNSRDDGDEGESINELSALNGGNNSINNDSGNGDHTGLNRLLRNGFSAEEIQTLRFLFSVNIRGFRQFIPQRHNETDDVYQLRLEEAFLESENILMQNQSIASSLLRTTHNSANTINSIVFTDLGSNNGGVRTASSSSSTNNDEETGDQRDFWFGFLVGVTVGFIVLFCVWDRNISYRQKLGLLFGVAISTLLEMYSAERITSSSSSSSEYKSLRGSQN